MIVATIAIERSEFEVATAVHKSLEPVKIATKVWESDKKTTIHEVTKQLWNISIALTREYRTLGNPAK